jgi:hypothetical protein
VVVLIVLTLIATPRAAQAQFPGYDWPYGGMGYPFPSFGYGMYGSPYGFGFPGVGYGYGALGFGYPGLGIGYPAFGYGGPLFANPYANPLFGVGLTPLGLQSYNTELNFMGRGRASPIPPGGAPVFRRVR